MPKTLAPEWPVRALTRVLDGLEKDLLEVPDEEILQAAKDLGMNPERRRVRVIVTMTQMLEPPELKCFRSTDCEIVLRLLGTVSRPRFSRPHRRRASAFGRPSLSSP
jgi:hypothetical protein